MMKIDELKYDENGLIQVIAQDYKTNEVLMCAYMDKESLKKTIELGVVHYRSRKRGLWKKGESSGHIQKVQEILIDCDLDVILIKVEQIGGACHTGYRSCFYRNIEGKVVGEKVFDANNVYK